MGGGLLGKLSTESPEMSWTQWWGYSAASVSLESDIYGVYELGDADKEIVYVGSGKVKDRLLCHLENKECPLARYYRLLIVGAEESCNSMESEIVQEYRERKGRPPLYNEKKTRIHEVD
ncbi:hypothetical protein A3K78_11350 [Candidatus Bathyarchaeota archaeon RBG_13_52_12]|nr:MAG: hypothetical protein A3K78_11350 [Candidatus Bathyarchaeota archaeon RBG_13_52_12]